MENKKDIFTHESPDKGKTIYKRKFGKEEKTLLEKCVSCDCLTDVQINEHIDNREFYVEGAGQLCKECWEKLYN